MVLYNIYLLAGGSAVQIDEESIIAEQIEGLAKANRTREILDMLRSCNDIEDAKKQVRALLPK